MSGKTIIILELLLSKNCVKSMFLLNVSFLIFDSTKTIQLLTLNFNQMIVHLGFALINKFFVACSLKCQFNINLVFAHTQICKYLNSFFGSCMLFPRCTKDCELLINSFPPISSLRFYGTKITPSCFQNYTTVPKIARHVAR